MAEGNKHDAAQSVDSDFDEHTIEMVADALTEMFQDHALENVDNRKKDYEAAKNESGVRFWGRVADKLREKR